MLRMAGKVTEQILPIEKGDLRVKYKRGVTKAVGIFMLMGLLTSLSVILFSAGTALLIIPVIVAFQVIGTFIYAMNSKRNYLKKENVRIIGYDSNNVFGGSEYEEKIYRAIGEMSAKVGVKTPTVAIEHTDEINAYAVGTSKKNSLIVLTSGLLETMEFEGVVAISAHELGHIMNGDMLGLTIATCMQNILTQFISWPVKIILWPLAHILNDQVEYFGTILYVFACSVIDYILFGISNSFVLVYSRKREFKADLFAAQVTGKDWMIYSLRVLGATNHIMVPTKGAMGVSGVERTFDIFATHPSIKRRIKRLERKAKY